MSGGLDDWFNDSTQIPVVKVFETRGDGFDFTGRIWNQMMIQPQNVARKHYDEALRRSAVCRLQGDASHEATAWHLVAGHIKRLHNL